MIIIIIIIVIVIVIVIITITIIMGTVFQTFIQRDNNYNRLS